ncbi:hypothetical protein Y032_0237g3252 [Ancylostoma ceylanicum]|uniref:Protein kinase domain-containing protein n=1 Tax=Ancylostoma ceylanicum TaxID=53326 RepID=A0A016SEG2_9BILA|nr:hypothetical protein Y032_0237g3252 [Ancylostoma ceylanicum]
MAGSQPSLERIRPCSRKRVYDPIKNKVFVTFATFAVYWWNQRGEELFTEVKGKYPNKLVRRAQFRDQHFDTNCNLLYHEVDKVTQRDKVTVLSNIRISRNLELELIGEQDLDRDGICQVQSFRSLLEQMLVLEPAKRITCGEAIKHPFFSMK